MKKHSGTILLVLIFFVGLAVMLYPTISDYINQRNQTRVVNSYAQQVDGLSAAYYTAYFDAADVFNQKIAAAPDALYHADRFSTYSTTLDIVDDVAERLLKAKTPYTFRERKYCTREALILAFLIYDIENLQERSFGDNDQILSIRRDSRN